MCGYYIGCEFRVITLGIDQLTQALKIDFKYNLHSSINKGKKKALI